MSHADRKDPPDPQNPPADESPTQEFPAVPRK